MIFARATKAAVRRPAARRFFYDCARRFAAKSHNFSQIRSLALLLLTFSPTSSSSATMGFLVTSLTIFGGGSGGISHAEMGRSGASTRPANFLKAFFTMRSSSE